MTEWLIAIVPTLAVGIFMLYFSRGQKKRDDASIDSAKARKEECLLSLELQMAIAKLSYATAVALKRGYANGEVETEIEAYELAQRKYYTFMGVQATEHITAEAR